MRDLDAEDLGARVGVGVEVDEADRGAAGGAGADVRLRDRVVAAEHDRDRAGRDDLADRALDRLVRAGGIGRQDRRVAVVDHPQLGHRVDLRLEVRAGRAARRADRPRPEPRARPVGDEIVHRRADDRDVHAVELGRILRVRQRPVREQARVVGLVVEGSPALDWVDHRAIVACGRGSRTNTRTASFPISAGCGMP